jgi:hypothetical protein
MRELRGRSEFAKSTFGVFSAVPTYLADSGLMRCVTSAASMPTDLMPTACRKADHLQPHELRHNLTKDLHVFGSYVIIIFSPTSCVTIWSKTCMFLARTRIALKLWTQPSIAGIAVLLDACCIWWT